MTERKSYFPVVIELTETKEVLYCLAPSDIPRGVGFTVVMYNAAYEDFQHIKAVMSLRLEGE